MPRAPLLISPMISVLDPYYLGITALVTVAYQLTGFAIAWTLQFDKITDFTGGSNFFLLALLTLLLGDHTIARNVVASCLIMVWGVRIAGFLLFRVLKTGSDTRFDDIRASFFKFLAFWVVQILWVWIVSLPVTIINSPAVWRDAVSLPAFGTSRDIAGIIIWALGLAIESIADIQKYRYKFSGPPKDKPITAGIWKWSRHPPYFGEIMCWWGIWIICMSPVVDGHLSASGAAALKGSVASPVFSVIILMFGSGLPTAAKPQAKRFYLLQHGPDAKPQSTAWDNYKRYLNRTSILIPIPPFIYRHFPAFLKKTIFFDFALYNFDEATEGPRAIEEVRQVKGRQEINDGAAGRAE